MSRAQPAEVRRVEVGAKFPERELVAVSGERVHVPDPARLVHLQLRRFAGCPVCNLHLRSLVRRKDEIDAAGVRTVAVFHSSAEALRLHAADLPFPLIADPRKELYTELGVEAAPRALLDPRAWPGIARAVLASSFEVVRGRPLPPLAPAGGRYGFPAEFLIAQSGEVVARRYGEHADDQWSADELLAHARAQDARHRPAEAALRVATVKP